MVPSVPEAGFILYRILIISTGNMLHVALVPACSHCIWIFHSTPAMMREVCSADFILDQALNCALCMLQSELAGPLSNVTSTKSTVEFTGTWIEFVLFWCPWLNIMISLYCILSSYCNTEISLHFCFALASCIAKQFFNVWHCLLLRLLPHY